MSSVFLSFFLYIHSFTHTHSHKVSVIFVLLFYYFVIKCMQACVSFHFGWFTTFFLKNELCKKTEFTVWKTEEATKWEKKQRRWFLGAAYPPPIIISCIYYTLVPIWFVHAFVMTKDNKTEKIDSSCSTVGVNLKGECIRRWWRWGWWRDIVLNNKTITHSFAWCCLFY